VNPLLILTAVEFEARALAGRLELSRLTSLPFLAFGHDSIRLAPVGLAAALCASRWAELLEGLEHPLVVSAGVCGALDPRLAPGDVVIPARVTSATGESHPIEASYHQVAARANPGACVGHLVTTSEVVTTPEAKASLRAACGADAVDMESAVIVARAAACGCPALVIRAVSDSAREYLSPELVGLVRPEGGLRVTRALALTLAHPLVLSRALTLRRRTLEALAAVAVALAALSG
jgi:adenosylhomocysteine nucleosidase